MPIRSLRCSALFGSPDDSDYARFNMKVNTEAGGYDLTQIATALDAMLPHGVRYLSGRGIDAFYPASKPADGDDTVVEYRSLTLIDADGSTMKRDWPFEKGVDMSNEDLEAMAVALGTAGACGHSGAQIVDAHF